MPGFPQKQAAALDAKTGEVARWIMSNGKLNTRQIIVVKSGIDALGLVEIIRPT